MEITGPDGFRVQSVMATASHCQRFRGLMGQAPKPLLLRTSSVHGFWLRSALWAVGLSADLTVMEVRRLRRRRIIWLRGARWILELPPDSRLPRPGDKLAFHPAEGEAEDHGGNSLSLRHADRQPR